MFTVSLARYRDGSDYGLQPNALFDYPSWGVAPGYGKKGLRPKKERPARPLGNRNGTEAETTISAILLPNAMPIADREVRSVPPRRQIRVTSNPAKDYNPPGLVWHILFRTAGESTSANP